MTKIERSKESVERELKVGQKVILMDSDMHGVIISLGKPIDALNKAKEAILSSKNNLRLANDKAEDLTIRKFTYKNLTMKTLFEKARETNPSEDL